MITDMIDLRKKIEDWVKTPEGKAELERTAKSVEEVIKRMEEARRIDPALLREPMTI